MASAQSGTGPFGLVDLRRMKDTRSVACHQPRPRSAGRYSSGARSRPVEGPRPRLRRCHPARREGAPRGSMSSVPASRSCRSRGACRLIVELAGEKDPARAKSIIQRTAFLEFRITDIEEPVPRRAARDRQGAAAGRVTVAGQGAAAASVTQLFGTDTGKAKGKAPKGKAATKDTNRPERPRRPLVAPLPGAVARRVSSCRKSRCRWPRACWRGPMCSG